MVGVFSRPYFIAVSGETVTVNTITSCWTVYGLPYL